MIQTYNDKVSEDIFNGYQVKNIDIKLQNKIRRKLRMLNNAHELKDLRIPPGNKLKKLEGNLKEYHSIRVDKQWRIIFKFENGNVYEVEFCDYH